MKVALIVKTFPNISETFVVGRFLALLDRGWDVHVFCERRDETAWSAFPDLGPALKSRVHERVVGPRWPTTLAHLPLALVRGLAAEPSRMLRYLRKAVRPFGRSIAGHLVEDAPLIRFGPDVIHFEFGHLAVRREPVADLLGSALVVSFQGWDINYVGLEVDTYYKRLWERVDAVHFVSEDLLARAKRRGLPAHAPVHVVHNGIDLTAFSAQDRHHTEVVGTGERPVRLLSVGRLHWKKGYEYALEAVRFLVERGISCEYRIVGDGEHREAIAFAIHDLGLESVTLRGEESSFAVRDQLRWADIFVHAAVSEGFCIAATEAQAMGVPVVSSDADGLRENVADGESGYVVARRDPAAIAEKIALLAGDPGLRERLGRAGEERVRTLFRLSDHVDGIESLYRAALKERGKNT